MKYLNGVLTVIAVCLVLITFAVTGIIPKANAGDKPGAKFVSVPVNADGTITVKLASGTIDVNIEKVGGYSQSSRELDVNIEEVGGYSTYGKIPVKQ